MAAFVKSVERFQITLSGSGTLTGTANLTKDQDLSQSVAFCTARNTATGADAVAGFMHAVRLFDDAGTKKIEAIKRNPTNAVVEATVIEFKSGVTVQSGGPLRLSGTSVTQTITTINQSNAFIVFSYAASANNSADDWNDALVQAKFNSDTEIQFQRNASGPPDIDLWWYVVESNGTDFQTEYVEFAPASNATTATQTLSNSVDLNHAFLVASYRSSESADDPRDAISNVALTAPDTISWYRNHGATPSATNTQGIWVVRSDSSGFTTQRFATDVNSTITTNQTITAVDLDKAAIFPGQNIGIGSWPITSSTTGSTGNSYQSSIAFSSTTNVQLIRRTSTSVAGSNNFIRYEVVEFELDTGAGPQIIPVGLVEEADSVLAVTPVAGAVSVPVSLIEETDSVLAVTPQIGGQPQTVPVDLITEVDSVQAVTPLAGEVTVPVGIVSETDTVFPVDPVITKAPQTVAVGLISETDSVLPVTPIPGEVTLPVGIVEELDQVAPVFPVVEGGPQTVLVVNVAERDFVFPVTPRLGPEEEIKGGIPTRPRKRSRKTRRYILPDNRVFTDPERALYELRALLKQEQEALIESGGDLAPSQPTPASQGQEGSPPDTSAKEPITRDMLESAISELPELLLARPEAVPALDPQLISVLFQMIDDEEAAILLL